MSQPFQIILLTPGFPADESDTACLPALQDFVLGWKTFYPDATISVIAFQYPHKAKSYAWHSIPIYAAGGHDRNGDYRLITWMKVLLHLLMMKKKKRTVLLSYFLTEATYVAQQFTKVSAAVHIAMAAGQDVKKSNPYLRKLNLQKLQVVVFNQKMKEELLLATGKNADAIIPFGLLEQAATGSTTGIRSIDLLVVGSLIPVKRVDAAIRIIATLKSEFPGLQAQIIGQGTEQAALEHLAANLQLNELISFTGGVSREVVREKMSHAKILLHTSASEGQSTVISEALSAGLYVVCFDVGRVMDHPKIIICHTETEMLTAMKNILRLPQPDLSPVEIFPVSKTIAAYSQLLDSLA